METLLGFIILLLTNIVGFALSALLAAWLFTLALPIAFHQALWLSLAMIIAVAYMIQTITDIPGRTEFGFIAIILSAVVAFILLALSGLLAWLLLLALNVDLTIFEATMLFSISLAAGLFFLARSGTGGLPKWMSLSNIDWEDEDFEDDYVVTPPPVKRSKRRRRSSRTR